MDKPSYEITVPWYVRRWSFIAIAVVSMFIPYMAILIIPLIIVKENFIKKYSKQLADYTDGELSKMHELEKSIIDDAQRKSADIVQEAQTRATKTIEEVQTKAADITHTAEKDAAASRRSADVWWAERKRDIENQDSELRRKVGVMNAEIAKKSFYLSEVERIKAEINDLEAKFMTRQVKMNRLMSIYKSVDKSLKTYFEPSGYDFSVALPADLLAEIEELAPAVILRLHSMDYKDLRKAFKANDKIINETLERYAQRYTTKANRAIYQLMVLALRAELQNILYTLKYSRLDEAISHVKEMIAKYLSIAEDGNRNISSTLLKFIGETEPLFIDAVKIEYEYYVKREAARQEQLELRAQMRAEAEEQKRLQEQREQMEKEEAKYAAEIENIQQQIQMSEDDAQNQQLLQRIQELEAQMKALEEKKEDIVRLQNGKAGYVYIISNLGSFGDNVFKVGMTRRLDPQERVDELGDASVPFKFDVHSFIFSQDAVKLESSLHAALHNSRLNKVNLRKEFFKVSLDDIESLVNEIEPSAPFNRTMVAEQYHQSLSMEDDQGWAKALD